MAALGRALGQIALWVAGLLTAALFLAMAVNILLAMTLFGPKDAAGRLVADWRRIWAAHAMDSGKLTPDQAFRKVYGDRIGREPEPGDVRAWLAADLEDGDPIVLDAVLARYLTDRFGAVDGRSLQPGVYLAAGPIGPDRWPSPLLTHYLMFPRHGYILIVPEPEGRRPRPAIEVTASLRRDFRPGGDGDDLFAAVQVYGPKAYDFPTPGEPVHDLFLLSSDPRDIAVVEARSRDAAARLDQARLGYGLFSRNSNSALSCFLAVSGLPAERIDAVRRRPLARLRLPGISQSIWDQGDEHALPECSAP